MGAPIITNKRSTKNPPEMMKIKPLENRIALDIILTVVISLGFQASKRFETTMIPAAIKEPPKNVIQYSNPYQLPPELMTRLDIPSIKKKKPKKK